MTALGGAGDAGRSRRERRSSTPGAGAPRSTLSTCTDHEGDIAIIGTGYVGLTVGACLAHLGHRVHCVDSDVAKVQALSKGEVPFLEEGLPELLREGLESGRLSFAAEPSRVHEASIVFLCLPTPQSADGDLNTSILEGVVREVSPHLKSGAVLVTKSTVPVGTHRRVLEWSGRRDLHVVSNPEFLREGTAVADFLRADRVVIGAASETAGDRVAALYRDLPTEILRTDPASAELLKYAANAFLATKISFANEISRLCDALGADIDSVIDGIGADPRIGRAFLKPGPGWGGSCFPKDTAALAHVARQVALDLPVVSGAIASNELQIEHVLDKIVASLPQHLGRARVAVWGLTYKAGTDDCRDSPAVRIVEDLVARGLDVATFDPAAACAVLGTTRATDPYEPCHGADAVVVLTEWPEFRDVHLGAVARLMRGRQLIDARNLLDPAAVAAAGLDYAALGRLAPACVPEALSA